MLSGKVAIITGGSRGIGREIALKLAGLGASVVINYTSSDERAQSVKEEIESLGGKAFICKADVSDFKESLGLAEKAIEVFGRIDILVNNAGITRDTLMLRMREEDFDSVININLKGTFNMIKHVSSKMLKNRYGKIISIASVVGIYGNIGQANYAASKAGIIGLTKSAAKELAGRGINVNAVAPGFIETDMTNTLNDKVKEGMLNMIPLKRYGKASEVANLVAFLASDDSSYITGQVISIDGGLAF